MASVINLDTAQRVDITCRKGDTFNLELTFKDSSGASLDLSGYSWKLDVRETDTSSVAVIEDNSFSYSGDENGVLTISGTSSLMESISGGIYVYDLQSTSAGAVKTWIYGIFKVNEDITV